MKIVIRTESSATGEVAVAVSDFRWSVARGRIVMTRGIIDGYYPFDVETSVTPVEIDCRHDKIIVVVANRSDIAVLAADLTKASEVAMKSFGEMRI